jgi:hypothetical protein
MKQIKKSTSYADEITHIMNTRKTPIRTDYIKATTRAINALEASVSSINEISQRMDDILGKIKVYKLLKKQVNKKYLTARKTFNNKVALRQTLGSLSVNVLRTHYPDSELTSPEKFIASQYLTPDSKSKSKSTGGKRTKKNGTRKLKK